MNMVEFLNAYGLLAVIAIGMMVVSGK